MNLKEKLQKANPGLKVYPFPGYGMAFTYDSLFENDYVVRIYVAREAQVLFRDAYSRPPWWAKDVPAIARTRDGNFWFYHEPDNLPPMWFWNGTANNKIKACQG